MKIKGILTRDRDGKYSFWADNINACVRYDSGSGQWYEHDDNFLLMDNINRNIARKMFGIKSPMRAGSRHRGVITLDIFYIYDSDKEGLCQTSINPH